MNFFEGAAKRMSEVNGKPIPKYIHLRQEETEIEVEKITCKEDPDCDGRRQARRYFRAFDQGFNGNTFAQNFSNCAFSGLDYVYREIATYRIKLKYADYSDAVTNTTLFL